MPGSVYAAWEISVLGVEATVSRCGYIYFPRSFSTLMVPQQRRPPQSAQEYYAVPQSPQGSSMQGPFNQSRPPARSASSGSQMQSGRGAIAQGVASGQIGGGYGPYSVSPLVSGSCPPSQSTGPSSTIHHHRKVLPTIRDSALPHLRFLL